MTPQEKVAALPDVWRKRGALLIEPQQVAYEACADELTALLSEHGEVTVTTDESGRCVAVTRQDSEGRILSVIWEASEHGGGGEAAPFAYVLVEGNPGSCAELMFPRDARKGERGAKAAWRELGEGLHPLYLHPPVATEPVAKLVNRIDSDGGKTTTFIRPTALGMDLPLGEYPLYTTPPTPSAPDRGLNPPPERERDMLAEAIRNAAVKRGIVREDASLTGPMLLLLCEDLAQEPSAPVVDDAMVERACEVLSEHALDGDGPSTHAMRLALTAALSGVSAPVGVEDWNIIPFTGSFKTSDERWEVYDPEGSGGAVNASDVRDPVVAKLLDALASRQAVQTNTSALLEEADSAVACSHNFATAKPDILPTEQEHILGLCRVVQKLRAALTPAATPRGEESAPVVQMNNAPQIVPAASDEEVPSRSRLRRIAAEKGEPAPRFDASEDGLQARLRFIADEIDPHKDPAQRDFHAIAKELRRLAATPNPVRAEQPEGKGEDALIALFNEVYEREWDRAADEADDRAKAIMGPADEHATRMAIRAVLAAAPAAPVGDDAPIDDSRVTRQMAEAAQTAWERAVTEGLQMQLPAWSSLLPMRQAIAAALSGVSAPVGVECEHKRTEPRRTHVRCLDCESVKTDSDPSWGAARDRWFPSLPAARAAAAPTQEKGNG